MQKQTVYIEPEGMIYDLDARLWIVDYKEPTKCLYRLSKAEHIGVLTNLYTKSELKINYCSQDYFISEEILDIASKTSRRKLNIDKINISCVEFFMPKEILINVNNTIFDFGIMNHFINKEIVNIFDICYSQKFDPLLDKFLGSNIFLSIDNFPMRKNSFKKQTLIVEKLIGLKIDKTTNRFTESKVKAENCVTYVTSNNEVFNSLNEINEVFNHMYNNSKPDIQELIRTRLNKTNLVLINKLYTSNNLKPFINNKLFLEFFI